MNLFKSKFYLIVAFSQFQNANSSQLWSIYDDLVHRDRNIGRQFSVTSIMESWTYQPSYPVVKCIRTNINRVLLSQIPFPGKYKNDSALWYVPLALTNGQQPDFSPGGMFPRLWLTPERPVIYLIGNFPERCDKYTFLKLK